MKIRSISVSELNNYIGNITKSDPILQSLSVEGEISNLKHHSSGNIYFSLKDERSKINCLIFSSPNKELDEIKEGDKVICKGQLNFYEKEGNITFIVGNVTKKGVGELYLKFLDLKKSLMEEGLFLEKHKKPLPEIPKIIGVLTSPTGSVIKDIYNVINNRYPHVQILVYPCLVQGNDASPSVINGIEYFNENPVDLIIIARGGGSFEELFPFNNEQLARKIFASNIPIISAIGHETDFTIADFVADARASTPSMAAEIAVPSKNHLIKNMDGTIELIRQKVIHKTEIIESKLVLLNETLYSTNPKKMMDLKNDELESIKNSFKEIIDNKIYLKEIELNLLMEILTANNPIIPLNKGFALVKNKDKKIIRGVDALTLKQQIYVEFSDGEILAEVKEIL